MKLNNRIFGLDVLRAFAIMFVVYDHGAYIIGYRFPHYSVLGFDGVSIFFVLSGYLIGGILIRTFEKPAAGFSTLLNFWSRRWLRTLPAYIFVLCGLLAGYVFTNGNLPPDIRLYFVFSQNLFSPHPPFYPEAWSLAVEEWFYLLIPLGILCTIRSANISAQRAVLSWIAGVVIAVTVYRLFVIHGVQLDTIHEWDVTLRKQVFTRLDSIMFGVLGAYIKIYHPNSWRKHCKSLLVFGLLLLIFDKFAVENSSFYRNYFTFTVASLATLSLLPHLSELRAPKHGVFKIFHFISAISYSMYLLNLSPIQNGILGWLVRNLPPEYTHGAMVYLAYWVMTIALAYLIYQLVELPFLNLRTRHTDDEGIQTVALPLGKAVIKN